MAAYTCLPWSDSVRDNILDDDAKSELRAACKRDDGPDVELQL